MGLSRVRNENVLSDNHGQSIVEKLAKLSKIVVSLEYFSTDFLQFASTTAEN